MSVLDNYTIRMSTVEDMPTILDLLHARLGDKDNLDYCSNIQDRYLLCFEEDKLIAMTGINESTKYKGLIVDWTLIDKDYEDLGIITEMLRLLLEDTSDDTIVYAEVYRYSDHCECVMQNAMDALGFRLLFPHRVVFSNKYHNCDVNCPRCVGTPCSCSIDLYIKGEVD